MPSNPLVIAPQGGATFLNAPLVLDLDTLDADYAVLGIPFGVPYGMRGVAPDAADAPAAVRARSVRFGRFLHHYDFDFDGPLLDGRDVRIVDCGDVFADPLDVTGNSARATAAVAKILAAGCLPIILGGDDSVPIPFLRAYAGQGDITVIQIDAHLDFRDEIDGVTEGFSSPMRRASEMEWVRGIIQVGMRGVGTARPSDVDDARAAGNVIVPMADLQRAGVDALGALLPEGGRFVVTIDLDGLDPSVAPAVGAPMPGGLRFEDACRIIQLAAQRGTIAGFDVVEMAPSLDSTGLTGVTAVRLIEHAIAAHVRHSR
ncbi:MAG: arginase [Chloroflexi bacterium]|nr:MAG: arginase [Chloroflexota bacterium]